MGNRRQAGETGAAHGAARAVKQIDADRSDAGTATFADLIQAFQQQKEKKQRSWLG